MKAVINISECYGTLNDYFKLQIFENCGKSDVPLYSKVVYDLLHNKLHQGNIKLVLVEKKIQNERSRFYIYFSASCS